MSQCQKEASCGLYCAREDNKRQTVPVGVSPSNTPPIPPIFMPDALSATTLPIYSGLGQAREYTGLHTPVAWLCTYMQLIVTDRVAWSVCRSVCHSSEPCNDGFTSRHTVWVLDLIGPKGSSVRLGYRSPWKGAILRGKGWSIVKYTDALLCAVQKRLNRYRCCLD